MSNNTGGRGGGGSGAVGMGVGGAAGGAGGAGGAVFQPVACTPTAPDAATPRRLWRLTPKQYANTVNAALTGKRPSPGAVLTPPAGISVPLEAVGNEYRFGTYSGTHGLTDFEFSKSVLFGEDLAQKLVTAVRTATCTTTTTGAAGDTCSETAIKDRGAFLFRRPLTPEEVTTYAGLAKTNAAKFGREPALAMAFQAMLLSPQFLFLTELGDPVAGTPGLHKLNAFEVASAISYTLTDGPADTMLWDAATKNALGTPDQIAAQVSRIMESPAGTGAREFVVQYFHLDRVRQIAKSIEKNCEYGRERLFKDASLLIESVYSTSRRTDFLKTLLTTSAGFAGCDSYKIYGLATDPKMDTLQMLNPAQRSGLLTHPAFLAGMANFQETLPVKRGRFVTENLLCQQVPDAPLDVVTKLPESMTPMRDKMAMHSANPRCAACHRMLDVYGLALENYDAYGRYRTTEFGKTIDASGMLAAGTDVDGAFKNGVELSAKLAGSATVQQCFVRHAFRYFMGRPEDSFDGCTIDAAAKAYAAKGDFVAAVSTIFTSPSFLNRRL